MGIGETGTGQALDKEVRICYSETKAARTQGAAGKEILTMSEMIYDMAIVGGGPGGCTAALYGARAGLKTVLLEKLAAGGQMADSPLIENYPGFPEGLDGYSLGDLMRQGAERAGAEFRYTQLESADLTGDVKHLQTDSGEILARTVVLAPGASPRPLGLPNEKELVGRGMGYCAACDGMLYRGKTVVVVGGGNTAVGDALHLAKLCRKVYLVHRRDELRAPAPNVRALESSGVEIVWNARPAELVQGEDGRLQALKVEDVHTGEVRELACDGVFAAIGRVPDTQLFREQVNCDAAGYFDADETTRTNLPGVYAVGDARAKAVRQVVTATADGAVAVHFAQEYLAGVEE